MAFDNNNTGNSPTINASEEDSLDGFLLEALRNFKDRTFVLKIEHTVLLFMADPEYRSTCLCIPPCPLHSPFLMCRPMELEFPPMNSFYRMLAHHVAAYYGLGHFVEPNSRSLVVQKNPSSRLPVLRLIDLVEPVVMQMGPYGGCVQPVPSMQEAAVQQQTAVESSASVPNNVKILKRNNLPPQTQLSQSPQQRQSQSTQEQKTINERAAEYNKARERIFEGFTPSAEEEQEIPQKKASVKATPSDEIAAAADNLAPSTFNPNAAPFIPSSATGNSGQMMMLAQPVRKIINIIDPSQARPPEHILCIADAAEAKLESIAAACPSAVFRAKPLLGKVPIGYLIFPSGEAARNALKEHAKSLGLCPWRPRITDEQ